jgi:hypothetical protein
MAMQLADIIGNDDGQLRCFQFRGCAFNEGQCPNQPLEAIKEKEEGDEGSLFDGRSEMRIDVIPERAVTI